MLCCFIEYFKFVIGYDKSKYFPKILFVNNILTLSVLIVLKNTYLYLFYYKVFSRTCSGMSHA